MVAALLVSWQPVLRWECPPVCPEHAIVMHADRVAGLSPQANIEFVIGSVPAAPTGFGVRDL